MSEPNGQRDRSELPRWVVSVLAFAPTGTRTYPLDDPCLDLVWVPLLGPTATLAFTRLAAIAALGCPTVEVDLGLLAQALGVGPGTRPGERSPMTRAIGRLERFGLARWHDHSTLAIARRLPDREAGRPSQRAAVDFYTSLGRVPPGMPAPF